MLAKTLMSRQGIHFMPMSISFSHSGTRIALHAHIVFSVQKVRGESKLTQKQT